MTNQRLTRSFLRPAGMSPRWQQRRRRPLRRSARRQQRRFRTVRAAPGAVMCWPCTLLCMHVTMRPGGARCVIRVWSEFGTHVQPGLSFARCVRCSRDGFGKSGPCHAFHLFRLNQIVGWIWSRFGVPFVCVPYQNRARGRLVSSPAAVTMPPVRAASGAAMCLPGAHFVRMAQ